LRAALGGARHPVAALARRPRRPRPARRPRPRLPPRPRPRRARPLPGPDQPRARRPRQPRHRRLGGAGRLRPVLVTNAARAARFKAGSFPVGAGNSTAKKDGFGVIQTIPKQQKPEAAYFIFEGGSRTGILILDLNDASDLPRIAESWFLAL